MSRFTGRQGKGAMVALRAEKRREAEARNAAADARMRQCGHVHGTGRECKAAA